MDLTQKEEATFPASSSASAAARIDGGIGRVVELFAALLTGAEVLILLAGVISRYVFHNPLVWSDELASILFLWLAMLGAVVAFRRGEHMRMSTLVSRARQGWRVFFDAFAVAVAVAFLILILHSSIDYALDEAAVVTPAMEIPNIWRALGDPHRLRADADLRAAAVDARRRMGWVALALLVIALIGAGLWMLKPVLFAIGNYKLVVFFVSHRGGGRTRRRADRLCVRNGDVRVPRHHDAYAPDCRREPYGRGHESHCAALRSLVCLPRSAN